MNQKTRIFSKGIQHFQQGGSNIAIGSPKPYTNNLPAVNINPLTLANHPIEINTTGITDQINKMRDLAFKREELAFKYKELDYKEGAQYLDLLGDIYKGIGSANTSAASSGGFGSLGVYGQKQGEINAKRNEIMSRLNTGNKSVQDLSKVINELTAFETSEEVLSHKAKAGFINESVKSIQKGDLGIYGPGVFNDVLDHVMKGEEAVPFEYLAKKYTEGLGGSVAAKDLDGYFKSFDPLFLPQEVITSRVQKNGLVEDEKSYLQKSPEDIFNVINSSLSLDPNGKALKHQLEIAAANVGTTATELLKSNILAKLKANEKSVSKELKGTIRPNIQQNPDGTFTTTPESKAGSVTEGDKDREFTMRYITEKYGHNQKDALNLVGVLKGDALIQKLEELEKSGKITPIGGVGGAGEVGNKGKMVKFGVGRSAKEVPATIEGIKNGTQIKENLTKFFTHDGKDYMVTADPKMQTAMTNAAVTIKEIPGYGTDLADNDVNFYFKEIGEKQRFNSDWLGDNFAKVYELDSKSGGTSAKGFDPTKLGEQRPATVKELGLPAAEDFAPPINSHLGIMSKDILEKNNMRVTDTSKYPHRNKMQSEEGRSFDVNFNKSESEADSLKKIKTVIDDFESRGLRAEYEVKTQKEKDAVIKANPSIDPARILVLGDQITGSHFSVYCDTCSRIQALQGGSNQTPQTKIQNTSGIVGKTAEELIGM